MGFQSIKDQHHKISIVFRRLLLQLVFISNVSQTTAPVSAFDKRSHSQKTTNLSKLATLALFAVFFTSSNAVTPLSCDPAFYQIIGKDLKKLDINTGVYTAIGTSTDQYNGMGWDRRTNLLYAMAKRTMIMN